MKAVSVLDPTAYHIKENKLPYFDGANLEEVRRCILMGHGRMEAMTVHTKEGKVRAYFTGEVGHHHTYDTEDEAWRYAIGEYLREVYGGLTSHEFFIEPGAHPKQVLAEIVEFYFGGTARDVFHLDEDYEVCVVDSGGDLWKVWSNGEREKFIST